MKKLLLFLLSACLLFSFASCGEPSAIEKVQQQVVSIGEQFLDAEITAAEARERLNSIKVPATEGSGKIRLQADISALAFRIEDEDSTYEDIQKRIENIKNSTYE
jgi:hypothetical protein